MSKIQHVVYNPSAAGSLRCMIQNENRPNQEVVSINDDLSYGPLNDLKKRIEYSLNLIKTIAPDDNDLKEYIESGIKYWPVVENFKSCKIIIWHSQNAPEQLALQLIAKHLQNLELHEISLSAYRGTGEFTPEKLGAFIGTEIRISKDRKNDLIKSWDNIIISEGNLRIWKNDTTCSVADTYYDNALIKECRKEFLNAARIVGHVLGESDQTVSDTWLNYRLIQLIKMGKILAKGDTKHLRTFEVCLPH